MKTILSEVPTTGRIDLAKSLAIIGDIQAVFADVGGPRRLHRIEELTKSLAVSPLASHLAVVLLDADRGFGDVRSARCQWSTTTKQLARAGYACPVIPSSSDIERGSHKGKPSRSEAAFNARYGFVGGRVPVLGGEQC